MKAFVLGLALLAVALIATGLFMGMQDPEAVVRGFWSHPQGSCIIYQFYDGPPEPEFSIVAEGNIPTSAMDRIRRGYFANPAFYKGRIFIWGWACPGLDTLDVP